MATGCALPRSGMPPAWYWPQPQIENGESRPTCQPKVRSQNTRGVQGIRLEEEDPEAAECAEREAGREPRLRADRARLAVRGPERHQQQRRELRPAREGEEDAAPHGDVASQKPKTRRAGMIASFVFELDTYCVNGLAAQANGSAAPR